MNDDQNVLKEFYKSIALAWAIAMTWAVALQKPWIGLSITFGAILGTALLASFHCVVRGAFTAGAVRPKRALLKLGLVKYPLLGAMLYGLARSDKISLPAFCGGILLVHVAIIAKVIGFRIVERLEAHKTAIPARNARNGSRES